MRIAIIGCVASGKTTLANALSSQLGVHPIRSWDALVGLLSGEAPLLIDGFPNSVDQLAQITAATTGNSALTHVLYLEASQEVRQRRLARLVAAGADAATARGHLLHPSGLKAVCEQLLSRDCLTVIDADGSRSEAFASAIRALDIGPGLT